MCKARVERSFDVLIRLQSAADPMDWNTGAALDHKKQARHTRIEARCGIPPLESISLCVDEPIRMLPRIAVIGTGGTISGLIDSASATINTFAFASCVGWRRSKAVEGQLQSKRSTGSCDRNAPLPAVRMTTGSARVTKTSTSPSGPPTPLDYY